MGQETPDFIFATLRNEILNLTIKPGQNLIEAEICERFSASRTPVRTAFQRLSDADLLKIIPYEGAFATLLDIDYIKQMVYLRTAVESQVIVDFMSIASSLTMERIRQSLHRQRILLETAFTAAEYYQLDAEMHRLWFEATEKELLWDTVQNFQMQYMRLRMLDAVSVHSFREIVGEHEQLYTVIQEKDRDAVKPLVERHLCGVVNRLQDRITTEFAGYFAHGEAQ